VKVTDIELSKIRQEKKRLWQVNQDKIVPLAESIKVSGLLNPISVLEEEDGYLLIAGEHRVLAYIYNQETTIPAIVHQRKYDDIELEKARCLIMEADENLLRRTPDGHEEAYLLWKRKEAYELLFPTPTSEKKKKLKNEISYRVNNDLPFEHLQKELEDLENHKTFAEDTAEKLDMTPTAITQKIRIGKYIDKETGEIADSLNVSKDVLTKIVIGNDDDEIKISSKNHIDTIEKINDEFDNSRKRNSFFKESYDKLKNELEQEEPKYNINHPKEFSELLSSKIENEYLPEYKNKNLIFQNVEKLYLKKSDNLFFCTTSYLTKHSNNLSFTKGFINLYIDKEEQFAKVTNILNVCDEEDKVLVECSTDEIFSKYQEYIKN
jgi:ParB family chromosome partitioning protein